MANSEKNVTVKFEGWEMDIFICDNGDLGLTVYEHGKDAKDEDTKCSDIIVDKFDIKTVVSC